MTPRDERELAEAPETAPLLIGKPVERDRWWQFNGCQVNWRDAFIGVYWKTETAPGVRTLSLYVCIVPCVVFKWVRVIEFNIIPQYSPHIDERNTDSE